MRAFTRVAIACLASWLACKVVAGEGTYRFEELRLEIPVQFQEKHSAPSSLPGSKIPDVLFLARAASGPDYGIQLRAAVIPDSPLGSGSPREEEQQLELVAMLLDKRLQELKAARSAFGRTQARRVSLGGHLALRATWVGLRDGYQLNGVMYCLLIGAKELEISLQGPGGRPDEMLKLALSAIDRLTLVKAY
jgi:hypothetical protein